MHCISAQILILAYRGHWIVKKNLGPRSQISWTPALNRHLTLIRIVVLVCNVVLIHPNALFLDFYFLLFLFL